jgi:hypothetical protein
MINIIVLTSPSIRMFKNPLKMRSDPGISTWEGDVTEVPHEGVDAHDGDAAVDVGNQRSFKWKSFSFIEAKQNTI